MTDVINHGRLTELVALDSGVKLEETAKVLRSLFDVIGREMVKGARVRVSNFGTWTTRPVAARLHRNPQNGAPVQAEAHSRPVFIWSPAVSRAVRAGEAPETFKKSGNRRGGN